MQKKIIALAVAGLVSGAATNFQDVRVGTTSVFTTGAGRTFDPAAAAVACGSASDQNIRFISN